MSVTLPEIIGDAAHLANSCLSAPGPAGSLPLTPDMLQNEPSGNLFGLTQNVGMGWSPDEVGKPQYLIVSTQGGLRGEDGTPLALGYHTGHWEIGLLVREAAQTLRTQGGIPFSVTVSDPCDGRSQGTTGMFDSLPYRNDAAITIRRLIRSLPTRQGVMGVATCDKGLPAMLLHAAFGGSTNLLLHIPAIAHAAGLPVPTVDDWNRVNRAVPRLVDALPNGPRNHPTVQVFFAGGVPEVMLHLRRMGLLNTDALTVSGEMLDTILDGWEDSERRQTGRDILSRAGVDPDQVIFSPDRARAAGLTSTVVFPTRNIAPEGSVIKATAIDPSVVGADQVYRHRGPARVFTSEREAVQAIKGQTDNPVKAGDVIEIVIDRANLTGQANLIGKESGLLTPREAEDLLVQRQPRANLASHPALPGDTRLWAALQRASGGVWQGCVYDPEKIAEVIEAGLEAMKAHG